ncbi:hypothetical protein Hanom_Chr11g01012801 [Helianthus anomalus]
MKQAARVGRHMGKTRPVLLLILESQHMDLKKHQGLHMKGATIKQSHITKRLLHYQQDA